jgi:hypothetical protein
VTPARLLLALLLLVPAGRVRAGAGVAGADVLKIPVEARGWGLGTAYSAIADDVGAMAYNPAGMASSGERELRLTYLRMLEGSNFESVLVGWPLGRWGTVGGLFVFRQVPEINNKGEFADPTLFQDAFNYSGVSVSDSVAGLYLAGRFSHLLPGVKWISPYAFGIGLKTVTQHIGTYHASGTALDLGVRASFDVIRFAAALQNIGGGFTFPGTIEAEADAMPQLARLAVAVVPFEDASASLTFALEDTSYLGVTSDQKFASGTVKASESLNLLGFGVEYWRLKKMGVRLGYVQPWGDGADTYASARGLTVGMTFRLFTRLLAYQLDFAYRPLALGGARQDAGTLSLSFRF